MRAVGSRQQPVADTPDRLEVLRLGRIGLDLLAQAPYVDGHRSRVERGRVPPDAGHELIAREHPPWMAGEEPEQIELPRGQPHARRPPLRTSRVARVELDVPELEAVRATRRRDRTVAGRSSRARRARAGRTASSRSRPRPARGRRCGPPRRRGP